MLFLQGFGFDFGDLTAILEQYLQDVIAFLVALIGYIWNVLVYVANYIWTALNWIAHFFYTLFEDVQKAFKWIWANVIKAGLTKLVAVFQKVRAWLKKTLQPVIDWLKKVRKWYDDFFNRWMKPVLRMIQTMRKVLTIFRLLGFKWAARLDGDLAMVEQKITQVYTTLRGYLNTAITWIDLIVDPSGILRRNPLFAALIASQNELRNMVLQAPARPLTGGEIDTQSANRQSMTLDGQKSNFTSYYSQGQVTPEDDQTRKDFAAYMDAILNGTSLPGNRPSGF